MHTVFRTACWLVLGLMPSILLAEVAPQLPVHQTPHWRQPVKMVSVGERIYTANQKSGTITIFKSEPFSVLGEIPVGQKLSDLAVMRQGKLLVAVDEQAHQVLVLKPTPKTVKVLQRIDVAKSPVSLAVDSTGQRLAVSSLWSRRVTFFQSQIEDQKPILNSTGVLDLPFSPRKMIWLANDHRLIAADSFGGRLAIINTESPRVLFTKEVAGHNIRGLAISRDGKDLLIAQQVLNATSQTTRTPIFWGDLMQNVMRAQTLDELLSEKPLEENIGDLYRTEPLGHPSSATGDPYEIRVLPGGQTVVSLSGVGEFAIRRSDTKPFERFDAQSHSTAILLHPDQRRLLIANTFADSITVFDLKTWALAGTVSLGPTKPLTETDRGERLFYDAQVSLDGWYSCHSCHTDGHTSGRRNDNLSDFSFGAPKRILPLGGVSETGPWAWNAQSKSLARQLHASIETTMQGKERPDKDIHALEAYLKTLKPAPSLDRMRGVLDQKSVTQGERVFRSVGCVQCHQSPTYTSPRAYQVGLEDEVGEKKFNPPSLRGVSQRLELFHDSRAKSLDDVLIKFQHGKAHLLNDKKRKDLLAFLRSL